MHNSCAPWLPGRKHRYAIVPALNALSVVLPVLNERDNLAELIPELTDVLTPLVNSLEILVVDDSSTDGTDELMATLVRHNDRITYISRRGQEKSLPQSLSDGVQAAKHPHVAWMDADGSMSADSLGSLFAAYQELGDERTVVVGSRFVSGGGFKGVEIAGETRFWEVIKNLRDSNDSVSAVILSRLLNRYLWLMLDRCCRDLASGFIVAAKSDVLGIGLRGTYGDYCVRFIYLAHRAGYRIAEVPYVCLMRRHGESKTGTTLWGLIRRGIPYVSLPFKIRRQQVE